ncbi:MAG: hypothetical protein L0H53_09350, partial [Candidatus Nitrosocosmicus sp.]|nr:hypothetical protein [Candidatus Nitrosocosmicus sp.]
MKEKKPKDSIDFILSHFDQNTLFPRKMMTATSNGQFSVYSKEEIFEKCMKSEFIDCRINAYPEYTEYKGMTRLPPNFIFIDLDLSNFSKYKNPKKMLDKVLEKTLVKTSNSNRQKYSQHVTRNSHSIDNKRQIETFQTSITVYPTVLWSGNGYHIYLPIQSVVLDNYETFSKVKYPYLFSIYFGMYGGYSVSEVFMIFAKNYFTDGRADPQHRPKYKSCLIRIPDTYNSKCLSSGLDRENALVKVIQKWNRYRLPIQFLTKEFRRWLIQEEINQKNNIKRYGNPINMQGRTSSAFQILWIERLLQTGIGDGRKETLRLILGPYLTKTRKTDYAESVTALQEWLDKCNTVKLLDRNFNPNQRIKFSLKNTKGFLILENLKRKYPWLYENIIK